jgi:hypothetical protein
MPDYKLTIEYSNNQPIYPFPSIKVGGDNSHHVLKWLKDSLEMFTDAKAVVPYDAQGKVIKEIPVLTIIAGSKPKYMRTEKFDISTQSAKSLRFL